MNYSKTARKRTLDRTMALDFTDTVGLAETLVEESISNEVSVELVPAGFPVPDCPESFDLIHSANGSE
jgi:hypothetical protein